MYRILLSIAIFSFYHCNSPSTTANSDQYEEETINNADTSINQASSEDIPPANIVFDSTQYKYANGAIELDWQLLSKVEFNEEYNEEVQAMVPYPKFDPIIKAIDGKEVLIKGYVIPTEEVGDGGILVLSAFPFSNCFFCGGAGPESVMDIKLKNKTSRLKTDALVTFRGKLHLNDSDLYYLNYILEEAIIESKG